MREVVRLLRSTAEGAEGSQDRFCNLGIGAEPRPVRLMQTSREPETPLMRPETEIQSGTGSTVCCLFWFKTLSVSLGSRVAPLVDAVRSLRET